ncbi:MAG: carboxymuconolactone decarboxylase family protein [Ktedonobacterales bacterium]
MNERIPYTRLTPGALKGMQALGSYLDTSNIEHSLRYLIEVRASQLNGCAYCLDMHTKDARTAGETEQRLYTVAAWREAPFFTERERAALLWTETLTQLAGHPIPAEVRAQVRAAFPDQEFVDLTFAISTINTWNRLMLAFETPAGSYKPELAR